MGGPGELSDPDSVITVLNADANSQIFTGLTPNSPYEVVICALTNTGCGINVTVNQTTDEDGNKLVHTQNMYIL